MRVGSNSELGRVGFLSIRINDRAFDVHLVYWSRKLKPSLSLGGFSSFIKAIVSVVA